MAYSTKRRHIKLPPELGEQILQLNMPGSQTARAIWLIKEGITAHPELWPRENTPPAPVHNNTI